MTLRLSLIALIIGGLFYTIVTTIDSDNSSLDQSLCNDDCIRGYKSDAPLATVEYLAFVELAGTIPKINTPINHHNPGDSYGFKRLGIDSVSIQTDGIGLMPVVLSNSKLAKPRYTIPLFRRENLNQLNYKGTLAIDLNQLNIEELEIPLVWTGVKSDLEGEFEISLIQKNYTNAVLVNPYQVIAKTLPIKVSADRKYPKNVVFLPTTIKQNGSPLKVLIAFK